MSRYSLALLMPVRRCLITGYFLPDRNKIPEDTGKFLIYSPVHLSHFQPELAVYPDFSFPER